MYAQNYNPLNLSSIHKAMCVEEIGVTYDPLFQLDNVRDINYRTEETPTDSTNINNGHKYTYDANGNLVYINTSRVKRDGKEDEKATDQKYRWDEENRLLAADENGFVSNYWYDADGERTAKTSGENEAIFVNSEFSGGNTGTARFSLYVSPYLVAGQGGKYTKHIYIGSQRIVSKLGDLASYGADPRRIPYAGNEADGLTINYKDKYYQQLQSIKDNYKTFDLPYNGVDNTDYVNSKGFSCDDDTPEAAQARAMARTRAANGNFKTNEEYEKMQFYYHPDHLGSSSYITNLDGEVSQHIEYVPFGEVFIEERNNTWNTPYLFNAKEFDEETGLYYYGARYYEPRLSLWMSVDPLTEKNNDVSGYIYCHNRPTILTDPTGMDDDVPKTSKGNIFWYPNNTAKGFQFGLKQQYQLEPSRGATVTGIRDTKLGRVSPKTGKHVGNWVIRIDKPHPKAPTPHININEAISNTPDPHTSISPNMLRTLGNGGKVLNTVGKVAKPIGIATDATRITTAYIEDGGKIGNATITTSSSVAGGWAGAWGGAVLVGKGGAAIGGVVGGPVGAAIGGFAGSLVGGIAGAFGGSWLGEKAAGEVLNSNKK